MSAARRILLFAFVLSTLPACRTITDLPLWGPLGARPRDANEVNKLRDISYHDAKDADAVRHSLDLYVPKGKKDFPVVVFVHGGAWMIGDNRCCGLYPTVADFLASQGIGVVMPNYRLSPQVKHPEHIKDIARAFAWTKKHIGEHGGDAKQLFLLGHSAGGHLVALLATDDQYLKAEGCKAVDIKGVIGVSGVYRIPAGKAEVELGGSTPLGIRLNEMAPVRGTSAPSESNREGRHGVPVSINVFGPAFGDDAKTRADASPIVHVKRGLPPFLLVSAERDLPLLL
jgi:acetyl esterase/lipase